jgi:hypothetical protein
MVYISHGISHGLKVVVFTAVFWLDFTDPSAFSSRARQASSAGCSLLVFLIEYVLVVLSRSSLGHSHIGQLCVSHMLIQPGNAKKAEEMPKSSPTADHLVGKLKVPISGAYLIDIVHNVFHGSVIY